MGNLISKILLILFLCIIHHIECGFFRKGAKIEGALHYLRTCQVDKDTRQILHIKSFKYNHTQFAANVNLTVLEPFDRSYKLHVEVQKWGDGGWKRNFFNLDQDDACGTVQPILANFGKEIQEALGMKPGCPVEAGFYKLENFTTGGGGSNTPSGRMGGIDLPFIIMPGIYYGLVHLIKHRKISVCGEMEMEFKENFDYK